MNRKTIIAVICGMLTAGLVFLIAGLIAFFAVKGNMLAYMLGLFAIFFGALMAGFSLIGLAITLSVWAIQKSKIKKENDRQQIEENIIDNGEENG